MKHIKIDPKELLKNRIIVQKAYLASTDYLAIKHSEGLISDEEYEPIKNKRQEARLKINKFEEEINKLEE